MLSPIEKTTRSIVRRAEEVGYDENGLNYQQLLRAMTFALVSLNEKQRVLNESQGHGNAS
jgi:hypothetical protein